MYYYPIIIVIFFVVAWIHPAMSKSLFIWNIIFFYIYKTV